MNRIAFFLLFVVLFSSSVLSSQTVLKGTIRDADTGLPLSFVNVGFIDKGFGTVSNEKGFIYLEFDSFKLSITDTLRISYLSYKDHKIPYSELQRNFKRPLEINLKPETINLNEVVLTGRRKNFKSKKKKVVGYTVVGKGKTGSWEGEGALGGELVTKIKVVKKERELNAFYFYVLENISDSLLIRVNVYEGDTPYPEKKIVGKNILYTLKTKRGKVGIDLSPYNIIVNNDFSIGIELLKNYGRKIKLVLAADDFPGVSYRRYTSQGTWKRHSKDALTYSVSTTLLNEEANEKGDISLVADYSEEQLLKPFGKNPNLVSGFVFKDGKPAKNVQIKNKTTGKIAFTNEEGRYEIEAKINDELEFTALGMEPEFREVLESSYPINISFQPKVIELDNVTVIKSKKRTRSQKELFIAFDKDKEIIKTAFGFRDSRQINSSLPVISGEQINKGVPNILLAIQGLFPSLRLIYDDWGQIIGVNVRNNVGMSGNVGAIYDVDGMVYEEPPLFLPVSEMDRVALLYPGEASTMYGYRGGNGVVVINTKGGNFSPSSSSQQKQSVKLVKEKAISEKEARRNWPDFLKELYKSNSLITAIKVYDSYVGSYGTNPNFNVDASTYFMEYWSNEEFTEQLIIENLKRFENDSAYLKAMAFLMDKQGKTDKSITLYKRLMVRHSNFAQSYRDLANAYVQANLNDRGTNLYARYFNLVKEGFFTKPPEALEQVINTEVKMVLDIPDDVSHPLLDVLQKSRDDSRTRILLEWNDDSAEISFQFVSQNQSTNEWSNATGGNNRFKGYTSKDFLIYGNPGSWQINANYKGNVSGLATYLKVTISHEYGTHKQQDKIQLFRLDIKNVNRRLLQTDN